MRFNSKQYFAQCLSQMWTSSIISGTKTWTYMVGLRVCSKGYYLVSWRGTCSEANGNGPVVMPRWNYLRLAEKTSMISVRSVLRLHFHGGQDYLSDATEHNDSRCDLRLSPLLFCHKCLWHPRRLSRWTTLPSVSRDVSSHKLIGCKLHTSYLP